jgi:hypothetical protein
VETRLPSPRSSPAWWLQGAPPRIRVRPPPVSRPPPRVAIPSAPDLVPHPQPRPRLRGRHPRRALGTRAPPRETRTRQPGWEARGSRPALRARPASPPRGSPGRQVPPMPVPAPDRRSAPLLRSPGLAPRPGSPPESPSPAQRQPACRPPGRRPGRAPRQPPGLHQAGVERPERSRPACVRARRCAASEAAVSPQAGSPAREYGPAAQWSPDECSPRPHAPGAAPAPWSPGPRQRGRPRLRAQALPRRSQRS